MIRRLYDWTISLSAHPRALWALAIVAFVESSFFPIPPDILMIPMILAAPTRAWLIALVATVSSVLGGMFGYFIGAALFDTVLHMRSACEDANAEVACDDRGAVVQGLGGTVSQGHAHDGRTDSFS